MKSCAKAMALLALTALFVACSSQKLATTRVSAVKPKAQASRNPYFNPLPKLPGQWTVAGIVQTYGATVSVKLKHYFAKAKVSYPPKGITLVALKQEKKLELWAKDSGGFRFIRDYYILGASGEAGPKLRQGDRQVPEGVYRITELNPNSHYSLSMKIDYPNEFDLFHAAQDGRSNLGSDIFIHGKTASIGCLAMGDEAIKELFILTALVGAGNVKVVISPHDPRAYPLEVEPGSLPEWTTELYSIISQEINTLPHELKSANSGL